MHRAIYIFLHNTLHNSPARLHLFGLAKLIIRCKCIYSYDSRSIVWCSVSIFSLTAEDFFIFRFSLFRSFFHALVVCWSLSVVLWRYICFTACTFLKCKYSDMQSMTSFTCFYSERSRHGSSERNSYLSWLVLFWAFWSETGCNIRDGGWNKLLHMFLKVLGKRTGNMLHQ